MVRGVIIVRDRMNTNGAADHKIWTKVTVQRNVKETYSFTSKLRNVHNISWQLLPNYAAVRYVKMSVYAHTYNTVLDVVRDPLKCVPGLCYKEFTFDLNGSVTYSFFNIYMELNYITYRNKIHKESKIN
jgi:hypothetical protein